MADLRLRVTEAERERYLKRGGAGIAVAIVHILILIALLTANQIGAFVRPTPKETLLLLPPLQKDQRTKPAFPVVPVPTTRPVNIPPTIPIITAPPPPSTTQKPGDVMQAIGRELACGAGSYENLSQVQREACRRQPWRFKKNEKGVIVLDKSSPSAPPPSEPITGIDAQTQIGRTTDPCVAAGNTHSECIHKTIFGR